MLPLLLPPPLLLVAVAAAAAAAAASAAAAAAETVDPPGSNTLKNKSAAALRRSRPASAFDGSDSDTRRVDGAELHERLTSTLPRWFLSPLQRPKLESRMAIRQNKKSSLKLVN